ncbi:MAG: hypothetical protein ISR86_12955 [Nitrospinaceae bacterium]|nr:hypothetical protein [Nitrospinaceae bacterium]
MNKIDKKNILLIIEDKNRATQLEEEMKSKVNGNIISSGLAALKMIKHFPAFSDIFIPLELKDLDYSDFIRFAQRYSPGSNYILIAPPTLPDLGWLMLSNEIDGYIEEPFCFSNILDFYENQKQRIDSPRSILLTGTTGA